MKSRRLTIFLTHQDLADAYNASTLEGTVTPDQALRFMKMLGSPVTYTGARTGLPRIHPDDLGACVYELGEWIAAGKPDRPLRPTIREAFGRRREYRKPSKEQLALAARILGVAPEMV